MYISRELILGLALKSNKLEFNNEDIETVKQLLASIIHNIKNENVISNDFNSKLDEFWQDYYFVENGFYKLKNVNDKYILRETAFNTLIDILQISKLTEQEISNVLLQFNLEIKKIFNQKKLVIKK